jgi:hypothetical protein
MPLTARRKSKLITMTLAVTGLGTLVALSFVSTSRRDLARTGIGRWHTGPDRRTLRRPAGEACAGQNPTARASCCWRGMHSQGVAEALVRPPASTALSDLPLPKTSEGRVLVSATTGAPGNVGRIRISTQRRSSL